MSSSVTKRSTDMGIFGDESVRCVVEGNLIAARFALLAMVAAVRGVWWCAT